MIGYSVCLMVGKENVLAELNYKKIWSENVLKLGSKEVPPDC